MDNQAHHDRLQLILDLQALTLLAYFGDARRDAKAILHKRLKEMHGTSSLEATLKHALKEIPSRGADLSAGSIERLVSSYCGILKDLRVARLHRKSRQHWAPLKDKLFDTLDAARRAADSVLGKGNTLALKVPGLSDVETPGTYTISPLWHRQMDAVGGPGIGHRFIARAVLVDQIGEYDLFEVTYFENGAQSNTAQVGYVGRFRGTTIRGFGVKPETALSWTRRQVVMRGTKALTK